MKIKILIDENLSEDEIIIRCKTVDSNIQKLQKSVSKIFECRNSIAFFDDDKEYFLDLNEILFFETEGSIVYAHTDLNSYRVKYRLYELSEILPGNFIRISKSTILNINKIYSITKNITASSLVTFYNTHKKVYVSRQYYGSLKKELQKR